MKNPGKILSSLLTFLIINSCASFVKQKNMTRLKEYEKNVYILKKDTGEGNHALKKGEKIKLYIINGDDSIKVYSYPAGIEFVKAERTLILYIFEDEFQGMAFNMDFFKQRLFEVIKKTDKSYKK